MADEQKHDAPQPDPEPPDLEPCDPPDLEDRKSPPNDEPGAEPYVKSKGRASKKK